MPKSDSEYFSQQLLQWYSSNQRSLPWRETNDPYHIWLSEILLQQTRVNQGLPYYIKFVNAFPNIKALAAADEQTILRLWQGLGYYSRARNLHATAKAIVETYKAEMPDNYDALLKLKGIGKYTAAAIASFAFKEKVAVLDGNVYRVLSRVFGIDKDILSTKGTKEFRETATALLPAKNSHVYNQAIMEFGALHCTPSSPACQSCPLDDICFAKKYERQSSLPVKIKKINKRERYFNYLIFRQGKKLFLQKRMGKDIWNGLFEFHLMEQKQIESIDKILQLDPISKKLRKAILEKESPVYKHILTHQTIFAKFWMFDISSLQQTDKSFSGTTLTAYSRKQIMDLPKPVLINNFLLKHFF
ncbi:MAG TPA: A/G-specific adenine glycosylase [Cytophagaceae bacterium]|jgi:A/G-specific adenine glycosylase|nr:A/G-specific adenine glycosylase [Cytophagaceae bacterium]